MKFLKDNSNEYSLIKYVENETIPSILYLRNQSLWKFIIYNIDIHSKEQNSYSCLMNLLYNSYSKNRYKKLYIHLHKKMNPKLYKNIKDKPPFFNNVFEYLWNEEVQYIPYDLIYNIFFRHIVKEYGINSFYRNGFKIISYQTRTYLKKNLSSDLENIIYLYFTYPTFNGLNKMLLSLDQV